ncbi:MAG: CBS domain-containing protein [Candidatus Micrarchaeia archaeon]
MENLTKIPDELVSKVGIYDYGTPIASIMKELAENDAVIIKKDKDYYGIIDSRAIYRSKLGLKVSSKEKAGKFVVHAPKISDSTSIDDVVLYFFKGGVKALPYVKGNKIIGVLKRATLLRMLLSIGILNQMSTEEAMSTPVLAISGKVSLAQADSAMRDNKVNRLVVVNDNGKFEGLITRHDLIGSYTRVSDDRLPEMKTGKYKPSNVPIESIMEKSPKTISAKSSVAEAVRKMVEENVSSLVVVDQKNMPIGMLTVTDVLEHIIATRRIAERKVFISGLDAYTYEFEDEIREQLNAFIDKTEKMKGMKVDYVSLRIKGRKGKLYELQARVSLGKKGIISISTTGYMFDKTFGELMYKLEDSVKKIKEKYLTFRKVNLLRDLQ